MSMTTTFRERMTSTVALEFAVAATGLFLVLFVIVHLAGNLLILVGPEAFNTYAHHMEESPQIVWPGRILLLLAFPIHIGMAITLARANRKAAGEGRYAVEASVGRKTPATRFILYSGIVIFAFVLWHLADFTLEWTMGGRESDAAMVDGEPMYLYGLVWNGFANPIRSLFYVIAVVALGAHLSHAISSVLVTTGFLSDENTAKADMAARAIGAAVALGFASIPIYVLTKTYLIGA